MKPVLEYCLQVRCQVFLTVEEMEKVSKESHKDYLNAGGEKPYCEGQNECNLLSTSKRTLKR